VALLLLLCVLEGWSRWKQIAFGRSVGRSGIAVRDCWGGGGGGNDWVEGAILGSEGAGGGVFLSLAWLGIVVVEPCCDLGGGIVSLDVSVQWKIGGLKVHFDKCKGCSRAGGS